MNSNLPKSSNQMNDESKNESISNFQNGLLSNSNIMPLNRISILKTEEQKEIVRTNVYEPNENKLGQNPKFCVVTEVIKRSSNISLDPQHNSFNNGPLNFSFNQDDQMNQSFQNKSLNIYLADSSSKKIENKNLQKYDSAKYKSLIKKIACQLKNKIREPTYGYFYFAFQKGNYPLMIIRKIKKEIINHSIEFSNDIFRIYTYKYTKYKELIKRIALILKKTMKNAKFWENQKNSAQTIQNSQINNQTIQVKLSQNNLNNKTNGPSNSNNNNSKNNNNRNKNNDITKKNNSKEIPGNKKIINSINNRVNSKEVHTTTNNKIFYNSSLNHNQKKSKPQTNKISNFKSNLNYPNNSHNYLGSHKASEYVNPFISVKDRKKVNITKKNDNINNRNQFLNKSHINKEKSKNLYTNNITYNNNHSKIDDKNSVTLTNDEKAIKVNINQNINTITNEIHTSNIEVQEQNNNKMDIIKEEVNPILNDISLNLNIPQNNNNVSTNEKKLDIILTQSEPILNTDESNDIVMNTNFNKINSDIIPDKTTNIFKEKNNIIDGNNLNNNINIGNNIVQNNIANSTFNIEKNSFNVNNQGLINNNNSADINNNKRKSNNLKIVPSKIPLNNNNKTLKTHNNNNTLNEINNNIINNDLSSLLVKQQKEQRISINSRKSQGMKLEIKLSNFKKEKEDKIIPKDKTQELNKNFIQNEIFSTTTIKNNNIAIDSKNDLQNINNNINIKNELIKQNSFINEYNSFLSNNNILIESYLPIAKDEKGQNCMKQNTFWEKYILYLYNIYIMNNIKISLFLFIQLIEQYFIWCENASFEDNLNFKNLLIENINKIYNEQEKNQFLSMNKMNNFDELFKKYEIVLSKKKSANYIYGKEIEIKLDNCSECNCELCQNEIACQNKMSEINKNLITNVSTENIFYSGKSKKIEKIQEIKNPKFSKSKTLYTFEYQYKYVPQIIKELKKDSQENKVQEEIKKSENKSVNKSRKKQNSKNKKKDIENFIELSQNNKIDDYFDKEKETMEDNDKKEDNESDNDDEEKSKKSYKKKKSPKKDRKNRKRSFKNKESYKTDSEEEKAEKNKKKKKKKKSRGKSKQKIIEIEDSENSSDNEDKNKNRGSSEKKRNFGYPKVKKYKGKK